eukprot:7386491-Prymnesium_polylepis.1
MLEREIHSTNLERVRLWLRALATCRSNFTSPPLGEKFEHATSKARGQPTRVPGYGWLSPCAVEAG